jgi:hypothetical protein
MLEGARAFQSMESHLAGEEWIPSTFQSNPRGIAKQAFFAQMQEDDARRTRR